MTTETGDELSANLESRSIKDIKFYYIVTYYCNEDCSYRDRELSDRGKSRKGR